MISNKTFYSNEHPFYLNLETAVQDAKAMQDFDSDTCLNSDSCSSRSDGFGYEIDHSTFSDNCIDIIKNIFTNFILPPLHLINLLQRPLEEENEMAYRKQVKFSRKVRVTLIPQAIEFEQNNLKHLIWWNKNDYVNFKESAVSDIKNQLLHNPWLSIYEALLEECEENSPETEIPHMKEPIVLN